MSLMARYNTYTNTAEIQLTKGGGEYSRTAVYNEISPDEFHQFLSGALGSGGTRGVLGGAGTAGGAWRNRLSHYRY
jgi:hypothetical protein